MRLVLTFEMDLRHKPAWILVIIAIFATADVVFKEKRFGIQQKSKFTKSNDCPATLECHSKTECICECMEYTGCSSAAYCQNDHSCMINTKPFEISSKEEDEDCDILYSSAGDWKYVFGARNGSGLDVYNVWGNDSFTCATDGPACDSVFKSGDVAAWDTQSISQVMVLLYEKQSPVAWLMFDATGAGKQEWFSPERLIDSSISTTLSETQDWFCAYCTVSLTSYQMFDIIHSRYNCPNDPQWVNVKEEDPILQFSYETSVLAAPQFVYTKVENSTSYDGNTQFVGMADQMKIYVQ